MTFLGFYGAKAILLSSSVKWAIGVFPGILLTYPTAWIIWSLQHLSLWSWDYQDYMWTVYASCLQSTYTSMGIHLRLLLFLSVFPHKVEPEGQTGHTPHGLSHFPTFQMVFVASGPARSSIPFKAELRELLGFRNRNEHHWLLCSRKDLCKATFIVLICDQQPNSQLPSSWRSSGIKMALWVARAVTESPQGKGNFVPFPKGNPQQWGYCGVTQWGFLSLCWCRGNVPVSPHGISRQKLLLASVQSLTHQNRHALQQHFWIVP